MADITTDYLRGQLLTRRQKLKSAIAITKENTSLLQLLKEVDAALERTAAGTYGICEACHETIERERLIADPLVCYCLDHLTPAERRALEADLELAAQIQKELLPKSDLAFDGWEVSYHYEPLGPVSGDYCDVVLPAGESKSLFFLLGYAAGKGVAASMLMSHLHAIFRTLISTGLPVHQLVERASRIFCESTLAPYFATLICGRADAAGEIKICNAGHCPALLLRRGEAEQLGATGLPLGLFASGDYPSQRLRLDRGDTLFLFTDGLIEARSPAGAEYEVARLTRTLILHGSLSPRDLLQACLEDLAAFRSGTPLMDDLTVMVVRRTG
jgi:sigma-B regulation protein RsbU (phosphoserine phosphatase)